MIWLLMRNKSPIHLALPIMLMVFVEYRFNGSGGVRAQNFCWEGLDKNRLMLFDPCI